MFCQCLDKGQLLIILQFSRLALREHALSNNITVSPSIKSTEGIKLLSLAHQIKYCTVRKKSLKKIFSCSIDWQPNHLHLLEVMLSLLLKLKRLFSNVLCKLLTVLHSKKRFVRLIATGDGAKSAISCPPPKMGCASVDP